MEVVTKIAPIILALIMLGLGLGLKVEIRIKPIIEEYPEHLKHFEIPDYLAQLKSMQFEDTLTPEDILITSDTIVWFKNTALGKPTDANDAFQMLRSLSGQTHEVITSVCFKSTEKVKTIREAEIQACKEVDVQRIKSQDKSWKDEILMVWLISMLSTGWFESTRDNFEEWVRIINDLPDSVWYLVIIVFTATFSTKMTDKVLNRNKKK